MGLGESLSHRARLAQAETEDSFPVSLPQHCRTSCLGSHWGAEMSQDTAILVEVTLGDCGLADCLRTMPGIDFCCERTCQPRHIPHAPQECHAWN